MTRTYGDPADPPVLVLSGAFGAEQYRRLTEAFRYVIVPGDDADAVAVLDELGVAAAHVVGGERFAAAHPDRTLSSVPADADPAAVLNASSGGWGRQADRLANRSLAAGDATGWFDRLYRAAVAEETAMPWDHADPHPLLARWAQTREVAGGGRTAVVVGAGLGADAAYLAGLGFDTVAFDVSATAVELAAERFGDSGARFTTADLFAPPAAWAGGFDVVAEVYTVQALPREMRAEATAAVTRLVAPGGTLVAVFAVRDDDDADEDGPPWPLTRADMEAFARDGLRMVRLDRVPAEGRPAQWLGEYVRTG